MLCLCGSVVCVLLASHLQADDLLKVTVVNDSDVYTDDQVYVQMVGGDPNGSGLSGYVNLSTSTWTAVSESDNTVTPPGGPWPYQFTDYAKKLTELTNEGPHAWSFRMPRIISGRTYISFEKPAYFHVNAGPALAYPSAVDSTLPNYSIVFDKVELDWQNGQEPFMNTTTVDFFSISFMLELTGPGGTSLGQAGFNKTRKTIMDELTALTSTWQNCVVKDSGGDVLRFLSPQLLPDPNPFENYFDSYVNEIWTYYKTHTLTLQNLPYVAAWSATGQVNGSDEFVFTVAGTGETVTINNLAGQGKHIFGCDGAGYLYTTGSDSIQKQGIIRQMGAALNRSVLYNIKDSATWWGDPANFYNQDTTNSYSKILHAAAYNGYCYGFPYDDVGHYDTGISGDAAEAIITVQSMSSDSPSGHSYPIDLTVNKSTFSTPDTIAIFANVEQIDTPCYPVVWLELPNGRKRYFERHKGLHSSPTPYLGRKRVVVRRTIDNYPIVANLRFRVKPGTYYINAGAIDATQTTSIHNIVYIDDVDRIQLTVQ